MTFKTPITTSNASKCQVILIIKMPNHFDYQNDSSLYQNATSISHILLENYKNGCLLLLSVIKNKAEGGSAVVRALD